MLKKLGKQPPLKLKSENSITCLPPRSSWSLPFVSSASVALSVPQLSNLLRQLELSGLTCIKHARLAELSPQTHTSTKAKFLQCAITFFYARFGLSLNDAYTLKAFSFVASSFHNEVRVDHAIHKGLD